MQLRTSTTKWNLTLPAFFHLTAGAGSPFSVKTEHHTQVIHRG